jgi:hypothetical protein
LQEQKLTPCGEVFVQLLLLGGERGIILSLCPFKCFVSTGFLHDPFIRASLNGCERIPQPALQIGCD